MPPLIRQAGADNDSGGVMRLYSADEARRYLRVGKNGWAAVAAEIEPTWVGSRKLYSDQSINRYLRRRTAKRRPKTAPAGSEAERAADVA